MSEAQKVTINLGSAGLTYNTKEGDQVVSVKKSELDAKSEEFESVSISLKRLREENAALSERLKEALDELGNIGTGIDPDSGEYSETFKEMVYKPFQSMESISRYAYKVRDKLSKTPKKGNT